jgi:hypothetical protein
MTLIIKKHITRDYIRKNPDTIFLFGDNMQRTGLGGQAQEMRGEPNSFGIPTKWSPFTGSLAYFSDADLPHVQKFIDFPFDLAIAWLTARRDVCIPADGFGTGLAQLAIRAPDILDYIERATNELHLAATSKKEID